MDENQINKIKEVANELLNKMTIADVRVEVSYEIINNKNKPDGVEDVVNVDITVSEPQFLIGQSGQTLLDLQKILRMVLNRAVQKSFYVKLDINNYHKQKTDYLKKIAESAANEAILTKEKKRLPPMVANERRIVHEELSKRQDIITQSEGEGDQRYVSIIPK